jgi:hypothetical protein
MLAPLDVDCPACFSPAGTACTAPTDTSRKPVRWYHLAREDYARRGSEEATDGRA